VDEAIYDRSCRTAREYIRDCGLVVPRAFQCLTKEWADLSLRTMQVSRADLHRRCTEGKGRQYATRVGDPPGSDNGHLHSVNHLWHQGHCADLRRNILREKHSPMPACLKTLGDNCIASMILKPTRFIDRSGGG